MFISNRAVGVALPVLLVASLGMLGCVTHPDGPHGPACVMIEAASTIEPPDSQSHSLSKIAERNDLTQHEQTYLVSVIYYVGGNGPGQASALVTLLKNPCCTDETRRQIARDLRAISTRDARQRVVEALIANPGMAQRAGAAS